MDELDSWEVDGVTFHLMAGDDDDVDDVPAVKPFFTSEQLKNMDWDRTWRIKLIPGNQP